MSLALTSFATHVCVVLAPFQLVRRLPVPLSRLRLSVSPICSSPLPAALLGAVQCTLSERRVLPYWGSLNPPPSDAPGSPPLRSLTPSLSGTPGSPRSGSCLAPTPPGPVFSSVASHAAAGEAAGNIWPPADVPSHDTHSSEHRRRGSGHVTPLSGGELRMAGHALAP